MVASILTELLAVRKGRKLYELTLSDINHATASEQSLLFAEWEPGIAYTVGQLRRYGDTLYRCVQAHTSQADWTSPATPALWAMTSDPADEWPEW